MAKSRKMIGDLLSEEADEIEKDTLRNARGKDKAYLRFVGSMRTAANLISRLSRLKRINNSVLAKMALESIYDTRWGDYNGVVKDLRNYFQKDIAKEYVGRTLQHIEEGVYYLEQIAYRNEK